MILEIWLFVVVTLGLKAILIGNPFFFSFVVVAKVFFSRNLFQSVTSFYPTIESHLNFHPLSMMVCRFQVKPTVPKVGPGDG
jgi:hypothetical protein